MAETVTFKADGTLDGIILNTLGIQTGNGWVNWRCYRNYNC